MPNKEYFTTGEVAKICRVSEGTVVKWHTRGLLDGTRMPNSRHRRFARRSLIQFLKTNHMPLGELEEDGVHKVLLVSSDNILVDDLQKQLTTCHDFNFEVASDYFEAGMRISSFHPGILVLDCSEQPAAALQLAASAQKMKATRIKLVIAIASMGNKTADELYNAGFDQILKKPFDVSFLITIMRHHVYTGA